MNHHAPAVNVLNNKNRHSKNSIQLLFISLLVAVVVTACGGGGGGGSSSTNATTSAVISGNAVAGPIANGTVTAYAVTSSGNQGASLGTTTTDANGAYSLTLNYTGAVFLEITSGSYVDEATGQTVNVPTTPGSGLQTVLSNVTAGSILSVQITPLTTMAVARAQAMNGGLTAANINAANQLLGTYLGGIDILNTQPINPLVANSATGATQNAINYGLILAGLSEQAHTLGLANPLDLVIALAQDFSDGNFDGKAGSTPLQLNGSAMDPATGTTGLRAAIGTFSTDTSRNLSHGTVSATLSPMLITPTETVLHSFDASSIDGLFPSGDLIQATDGNFYGVSGGGGAHGFGTVYKVTPAGVETVLYSFGASSIDGVGPCGSLIQATDGNFYGVTQFGGSASNVGTIYKVTPAGVETVLHSFGVPYNDGRSPGAGLIQATDGNFYGTTSDGGAHGSGTVYKITPAGVLTILYSFPFASSTDGSVPQSILLQGTDGNFYGTTSAFGAYGKGTVYKVTPAGVETTLYSFGASSTDATESYGGLIQGVDGNFYGTTYRGGVHDDGTVYKITPAGVETVLYSFGVSIADGVLPSRAGSLIQGTDGNFYGTTYSGGANAVGGGAIAHAAGTAYMITPAGVETVLYSFGASGTDGINPNGSLIQGTDGNFYGTTYSGGANGGTGGIGNIYGTVYKIILKTPTATNIAFSLFPSGYFTNGNTQTFNLTGSDTVGDTFTGTLVTTTQAPSQHVGLPPTYTLEPVTPVQGVLNLINTKANATINSTGTDFYSTDVTNLMYFGWDDSTSHFNPMSMSVIPQTAMIGASGVIGAYSGNGSDVGQTETYTWQLTNAYNGLANLTIANSTYDGSTFVASEADTYLIDQQGNRQSVTIVITYPDGTVITFSGN
jgi:uncharacterized repeat protein (TIGR03803 family)